MTTRFRLSCLAICLTSAFAQAATDTWEGTGPNASGANSWIINALAVSPDGQTLYGGSASGRVLRYLVSPKVASVAVPANASYRAGANLDFTLTWSAAVTVSGSPQLALTIGGANAQASYLDSPTTTTTRFRYTLLAGQSDTDGITVGALGLNGGSIVGSGSAAARLTLNNVGATGSVLVDGSAPPPPDPTPAPAPDPTPTPITGGQTTVPGGSTVTVAGPAQITASGGSTVTLSGNAAIGATLTLPTPAAGQPVTPVTVNLGGRTLTIANNGGTAASFTVRSVTAADGSSQTVLVLTPLADGSLPATSISSTAPASQVLVVLALPGNGGQVIEVVSNGGAAVVTIGGTAGVTGGYNISLSSGRVTLPIVRRPGGRSQTRAATGTESLELYAGERANFDSEGYFASLQLGTASGDGAGDPLTLSLPSNLTLKAAVPKLDATVARLSQPLQQALAQVVGASLAGSQTQGVLALDIGGVRLHALPLGDILIDTTQSDGAKLGADGTVTVTSGGVVVRLAPSVADPAQLARDLVAHTPGATLRVGADGTLLATLDGQHYAVRPGWASQPDTRSGFADNAGQLQYGQSGRRYDLYPALADYASLAAAVAGALPGASMTVNADGTVTLATPGQRWSLIPLMRLDTAPTGTNPWWIDADGVLRLRNADWTVQGFGVK